MSLMDEATKYKWWIVGGVGGLIGLYILYSSMGTSSATAGGLSSTQAAVESAALQAETQQAGIAAAAQAANQQAATQQAAVNAAASTSTGNAVTEAQLQQALTALNDNTILQYGSIQAQQTAAQQAAAAAAAAKAAQQQVANSEIATANQQISAGANANPSQYVTAISGLYQEYLHRQPDAAGLAYYLGQARGNKETLSQISTDIANSPEAQSVAVGA